MGIPISYQHRRVYHFTAITNLASILTHGFLADSELTRRGLPHTSLDWETDRVYRSGYPIPLRPGETVSDFVPLYFCKLSPMLLMILNNKTIDEQDIIHFEFQIELMEQFPLLFTSAAVFPGSTPIFYTDPSALENLNWDAIDSTAWRMPSLNLRMARLAELFIPGQLPLTHLRRIVVWDETMAKQVRQLIKGSPAAAVPVRVDPGCYFIEPKASASGQVPAVVGPRQIAQVYHRTLIHISEAVPDPAQYRFKTLDDLRQALWKDLACLPETAELVGLETDNLAHKEDVGAHTRRVVAEALKTSEYPRLDPHAKLILEVAAFLHDIGKGPKSRWAAHNGRQQIDFNHPVGALPMLERILTREVAQVSPGDARLICLLVAYHDIIGGILFSGRRTAELLNVVHTPLELDLLMALSKADALAINPAWGESAPRDRFREQVIGELSDLDPA